MEADSGLSLHWALMPQHVELASHLALHWAGIHGLNLLVTGCMLHHFSQAASAPRRPQHAVNSAR